MKLRLFKTNKIKTLLLACFLSLLPMACHSESTTWETLSKGLEYTQLSAPQAPLGSKIHAFRIDLNYYRLDLALSEDLHQKSASVKSFAENTHALVAINGGFFDPDKNPLGLRMKKGEVKHNPKKTSWWGVFYVENGKPAIVPLSQFKTSPQVDFALQAGPRLVINGTIPSLKPGNHERSAIGITRDNKVIIAVTENALLTTTQLATVLQSPENKGGLNCRNALNLDGGSSSQLYANVADFNLHLPNYRQVTDAIVVVKR